MERETLHLLAGLAHDLRSPISAIAGHTSLLSMGVHGPIVPAQAESLRRIQMNQQHLLALINEFMDYAEAASGTFAVNVQSLALGPIVSQALDAVRDDAAARDVQVAFEEPQPAAMRDKVEIDVDLTRRMLDALLQDALVHSSLNTVLLIRVTEAEQVVSVHISSEGAPVTVNEVEFMFVPYARDSSGRPVYSRGSSLLLPFVCEAARAMEATVRAIPDGTRRIFQLDLRRSANLRPQAG